MFKKATWLFAITLLILVLFLPGYTKLQELRDRNRDLETKIKKLNSENAILYKQMQRLKDDPAFLERFAREKMGVVRKGEVLYKLEPEEKGGKQ